MPNELVTRGGASKVQANRDAASDPIIVANTLWSAADPEAYDGGQPSAITHLADFEASGLGRRDDARWSGALEVIPTKADVVLDLIRLNSLWPLLSGLACCAIEMISAATSKNDMDRFGWFPFRASPRQADVLIVAGTCTTKMAGPLIRLWDQMPEPNGASPSATARARVVATSAATRRSRGSTGSCPSTSTFRAAHRAPRHSCLRS